MSNLALDLIRSLRIKFSPVKMSWMHFQHEQGLRRMAEKLIAGDYA